MFRKILYAVGISQDRARTSIRNASPTRSIEPLLPVSSTKVLYKPERSSLGRQLPQGSIQLGVKRWVEMGWVVVDWWFSSVIAFKPALMARSFTRESVLVGILFLIAFFFFLGLVELAVIISPPGKYVRILWMANCYFAHCASRRSESRIA
jgi:hypothetical protein